MRQRVHWRSFGPLMLAMTLLVALPSLATAQGDWCDEQDFGDKSGFCEVREWTLQASGRIAVDASPNGGVHVEAWDRNEVLVRAKVVARAESDSRAQAIASDVEIDSGDKVSASGPKNSKNESWWVSYRVLVPRDYDLTLHSMNGGVSVEGVDGRLQLETMNGGIALANVAGDVTGRTTNGGVTVRLEGNGWDGGGLDVETTNGGVVLYMPDGYSAHLEAGTVNGGINIDFPVMVQGKIGKTISTDLGSGGATIRAKTTNGGVAVKKSG